MDIAVAARETFATPPTLLETKLCPPHTDAHLIQRSELLAIVNASNAAVVSVCAPAGYGKTTFLSQLAIRDESSAPVAWLSLDETATIPSASSADWRPV
ncbi:MAG: hypothetical protein JO057_20535 [Chloroflexi bacterium]|nr:hypothetical protein [Chloroflexota bacterium]